MAHAKIDALRQQLKAFPVTGIDLEPELMRATFHAATSQMPPDPQVSFEPADIPGVDARWIAVEGTTPARTIIYFHGGAYVIGSASTHRDLASRIARAANARVLAVNYRLAPEHPYPAALDDAVAAFRAVLESGTPASQVVLGGDSAGGGLALCAAIALRDAGPGQAQPAGVVCLSPWVDLDSDGASFATADDPVVVQAELQQFARLYVGDHDIHAPTISPAYAALGGLPPILLHVGGAEALRSDCEAFAARARAQGADIDCAVWDDMIHVWHSYAFMLEEGAAAIEQVGSFVERVTPVGER